MARSAAEIYEAGKRAQAAGDTKAVAKLMQMHKDAVAREAQERSVAGEAAYAGGAGAIRGAAEGASIGGRMLNFMQVGLPAFLAEKVLGAEEGLADRVGGYDPDALRKVASDVTKGYSEYQSPRLIGQMTGTIGEFAGGAATMPIGGPVRAVAQSVVPAVVSETAGQVAQRVAPEYEGAARLIGALGAPVATELGKAGIRRALTGDEARLGLEGSERARSIAALEDAGVKGITTGQKLGSTPLMRLEGVEATDLATREGMTGAIMRTMGSSAKKATPSAMEERQNALGAVFDQAERVASEVATPADLTKMVGVVRRFKDVSDGSLPAVVEDTLKAVDQSIKTGRPLTGARLAELRTRLGDSISNADLQSQSNASFATKEILDDLIQRSVGRTDPELYNKLLQTREQYRAYLTVMRALNKSGSDVRAGILTPAQISTAAKMREGNKFIMRTGTPLADLAYSAEEVLSSLPAVGPDMQRRIVGGGAALGAFAGSSGGPTEALIGGLLGAAAPRVAQSIVRSGPVQRGLMPAEQAMTTRLLERLARQGGGLLNID